MYNKGLDSEKNMNYRQQKKTLTKFRDKMIKILEGNPLNGIAQARYEHAVFKLTMLKRIKNNAKKAKKDAKGKKLSCSFGHEA